jgi:hypothetical protein
VRFRTTNAEIAILGPESDRRFLQDELASLGLQSVTFRSQLLEEAPDRFIQMRRLQPRLQSAVVYLGQLQDPQTALARLRESGFRVIVIVPGYEDVRRKRLPRELAWLKQSGFSFLGGRVALPLLSQTIITLLGQARKEQRQRGKHLGLLGPQRTRILPNPLRVQGERVPLGYDPAEVCWPGISPSSPEPLPNGFDRSLDRPEEVSVELRGHQVTLSQYEALLLERLLHANGAFVTIAKIGPSNWSYNETRQCVLDLREKLNLLPAFRGSLESAPGRGFRLNLPP